MRWFDSYVHVIVFRDITTGSKTCASLSKSKHESSGCRVKCMCMYVSGFLVWVTLTMTYL